MILITGTKKFPSEPFRRVQAFKQFLLTVREPDHDKRHTGERAGSEIYGQHVVRMIETLPVQLKPKPFVGISYYEHLE